MNFNDQRDSYPKGTLLTISQFAKLCGISRDTLLYYDKCGLLKPHMVNEKGYRFYTTEELNQIHSIMILQDSGMTIKEIKTFLNEENPYKLICVFEQMQKSLEEKQHRYERLAAQVRNTLASIKEARDAAMFLPRVEKLDQKLMAGIPTFGGKNDEKTRTSTVSEFYRYCMNNLSRADFFRGGVILKENIQKPICDHQYLDYLCIRLEGSLNEIDLQNGTILVQPRGTYAVINCPGGLENTLKAMEYLQTYIRKNDYEIIGNGYEFEVMGTFTAEKEYNCVKQIEIQIQEKGSHL